MVDKTSPFQVAMTEHHHGNVTTRVTDDLYTVGGQILSNTTELPTEGWFTQCWLSLGDCWCNLMYGLTVFGGIGNVFTVVVILWNKVLRRKSTFIFLMFMAFADQGILINQSLACVANKHGFFLNCSFEIFLLWFNDLLSYLCIIFVVAIAVERFILIFYPLKGMIFCKRKMAYRASFICVLLLAGWTSIRIPQIEECKLLSPEEMKVISGIIFYVFAITSNLMSLGVLIISALIVHKLRNQRNIQENLGASSTMDTARTNGLFIATSLAFVFLAWPLYFCDMILAYYFIKKQDAPHLWPIREIFYCISKLNNCINFYLYAISGKIFRSALRKLFNCFFKQNHNNSKSVVSYHHHPPLIFARSSYSKTMCSGDNGCED